MTPPSSGMASFNPRDMTGRIYVENHLTFLILNIYAQGLLVSEKKEDFYVFKLFSTIHLVINDSLGVACLDPRGLAGEFM